jgi:hypothetical protein
MLAMTHRHASPIDYRDLSNVPRLVLMLGQDSSELRRDLGVALRVFEQ